jgi:ribosome-associated heat shock protein Hsp15
MSAPDAARTRLDKWLWAARFYKHRTAATEAVDGGKVRLNGAPAKPSREVKAGDRIDLTIGEESRCVVVTAIAERRGSAELARQLYEETPESVARREQAREQRRIAAPPGADLHGRPTKRDRRHIQRLRDA